MILLANTGCEHSENTMRQVPAAESKALIRILYDFFNVPLTDREVESYLGGPAILGYHRRKDVIVFRANPAAQLPPIGLSIAAQQPSAPASTLAFDPSSPPARAAALEVVRTLTLGSNIYVLINGTDKNSDIGIKVIGDVLQPDRWDELFGPAPFERYVFEAYGQSILWAAVIDCDGTGNIFSAQP